MDCSSDYQDSSLPQHEVTGCHGDNGPTEAKSSSSVVVINESGNNDDTTEGYNELMDVKEASNED